MIISVIEKNTNIADPYFRDRYIGAPCHSFDEARELCAAHCGRHTELLTMEYINNGVVYAEVDPETGEVLKHFFVLGYNFA